MVCTSPITLFKNIDPAQYPQGLTVPCGKCLACRISKRKEWTMRCLHELDSHECSIFVTLTYRDDHLPNNSSLKVSDLQKFYKRLRKQLALNGRRIRHFSCGEYGELTQRPHYHAIIFSMSLSANDKYLIEKCWPYGIVHFGLAEHDSIQYVAQYIDKKFSGDLAQTEYTDKGRDPPFRTSSMGIGREFCDRNQNQYKQLLACLYRGHKIKLPRYYSNRLQIDPDQLRIKAIDTEKEMVERLTGIECTREEYYMTQQVKDVMQLESKIRASKNQSDKNLKAKLALKQKNKI